MFKNLLNSLTGNKEDNSNDYQNSHWAILYFNYDLKDQDKVAELAGNFESVFEQTDIRLMSGEISAEDQVGFITVFGLKEGLNADEVGQIAYDTLKKYSFLTDFRAKLLYGDPESDPETKEVQYS